MDLKALIAKARAEAASVEPTVAPVAVGGELVDVGFLPVAGVEWADLMATHPPRKGSVLDSNVGFNSDAVARDYPVSKITVGGEPVDEETWHELFSVLSSPSIKLIAAALWGMNQSDPAQRIAELGKAKAGGSTRKRRSPAK